MVGANGGKHAGFGKCQGNHLLHDPQNQLGAGRDVEFLEQAVQVRVRRVRRNTEPVGDTCLGEIVEDALNYLHLALCNVQGTGDLKPGVVA